METISDPSKWRVYIKNDNYFNQNVPFDFRTIYFKLIKAAETPNNLNPFYTISAIYDFTKFFNQISTALSMGFSDITEKSQIMRQRFNEYPNATDIQNLLIQEMQLNIHKLNGDNNGSLGHRNTRYSKYISATRTFLRLLWFLEYLTDIFESVIKDNGNGPIKTILGDSYNKVLAPRHGFLVRKAVGIALTFSSAGTVAETVRLIFGYPQYNDMARKTIKDTINLMKIIWNGGNEFYKRNNLLGLE